MRSKLTGTTLIAVAALVAGAAACSHSEHAASPQPPQAAAASKAPHAAAASPSPGGPAPAAAPARAEPKNLGSLPENSEIVIGIDVAKLRHSSLWTKHLARIVDRAAARAFARHHIVAPKGKCGSEIDSQIGSVLVGFSSADPKGMTIVVKGLDRAKLKDCVAKWGVVKGKKFAIASAGTLDHLTHGKTGFWIAWPGSSTLVTGPKAANGTSWLKDRAAGKEGLDANQHFSALLRRVDTGAAVWCALIPSPSSPMGQRMEASGASPPQAIYGSVHLADGVKLGLHLRFATANAARVMVQQLRMALSMFQSKPPFGKYLAKVVLKSDHNEAVARFALSDKDVDDLVKMVTARSGKSAKASSKAGS